MFFYTITTLINVVASTILGLIVYFRNRKAILNKVFALFCLATAVWASFYFFWLSSGTTKETALFFGRALNIAAIFIPVTYFHFITIFLNIYQKKKKLVISGYLLSFILFISGFTPLFVRDVEPELLFPWYPKPGITYHFFTLMFFSYAIYSYYLMFMALKKTSGVMNIQIKYVLIGTLIGFTGGLTNFLPTYNIPIPPFGNGLVVAYVVFIAFAILRYHLFGIKVILTETLVGIIGLTLLTQALTAQTLELKIFGFGLLFLFSIVGYFLIKSVLKEIALRAKLQKTAKNLHVAYRSIESLSQMKTEFLKVVNHQLRTPVSIIKGLSSMLDEDSLTKKKKKEFIKKLYLASERLGTILDDILVAQGLVGNPASVSLRPCNIADAIKWLVNHHKPLAESKGLKIEFTRPRKSIPMALFDEEIINRIISRLIDNAILYTDRGKIEISLDLKDRKDKKIVQISIKDSGIGLDKKDKKNLFKLFHRGEKAISLHPNGSGLGLFIVKKLLEAHSGEIQVESRGRGKGSMFIVSFPLSTKF